MSIGIFVGGVGQVTRRIGASLALAALLVLPPLAAARATAAPAPGESNRASTAEIRIGVLAFRSVEQTERQWAPLGVYLESRLPGTRVKVVPMLIDAVEANVRAGWIDFALTNPEPYVAMAARYRLAAVVTLVPKSSGRPLTQFGGVIFTLAERESLSRLEDVAGKTIAAATHQSFAGYMAQQWALRKAGVDIERAATLLVTGMPQDRAISAVIDGRADVGFVRTGVIEAMLKEGTLPPGRLKIIGNRQNPGFPLALSTELYPEWPLAVLPHVPEATAKAVTVALLQLESSHPAAVSAGIHGFAPPGNYASIEDLLLRLRVHPERLSMFGAAEVIQKYATQVALIAAVLVSLALVALVYLRRQNRRLTLVLSESTRLAQREELLDGLNEGVYGVDPEGRCTFINQAAADLLGFSAAQLLGGSAHAAFHHHYPDGRPYPADECPVHQTLVDGQRRGGEDVFFTANGDAFPVRFAVRAIERHGAISGVVVSFQDIREEKAAAQKIREMALHDSLTGLPNRRLLWDRLSLELARAGRAGQRAAVLFIDLDGFKEINDRHGHEAGDTVLIAVAERLKQNVRAVDTVARLGGDEFVVILAGTSERPDINGIADKLIPALARPVQCAGAGSPLSCALTASIGVAVYPEHGASPTALVHHADLAMYEAKRAGKNRWALWPGSAR